MAERSDRGIGLLPKLMVAVLTPVLVSFGVIAYIYFFQMKETISTTMREMENLKNSVAGEMETMRSVATQEGVQRLKELGERMIQEKSRDVAHQIETYLKTRPNPKLKMSGLMADQELGGISVQPVGETGYTAVHDDKGINYFHKNPKIVGTDLRKLSKSYPEFWKILERSLSGHAHGYYDWPEPDGTVKPKYMVITPVTGTRLRVAATTYIDEFSAPARQVELKLKEIHDRTEQELLTMAGRTLERFRSSSQRTLQMFLMVVALSVIVIVALTYWFSKAIVRPIIQLTRAANRISMGDLDTKIEIASRDEVGLLAESFSRMQESLRVAILRLRKRRTEP